MKEIFTENTKSEMMKETHKRGKWNNHKAIEVIVNFVSEEYKPGLVRNNFMRELLDQMDFIETILKENKKTYSL